MSDPTLTQLENTAMLLGFPLLPERMRPPYYEESLRNLHALASKALLGDDEAARRLTLLQEAFGAKA